MRYVPAANPVAVVAVCPPIDHKRAIEIEENGEWEMPTYQEQGVHISATFNTLSIFLK